ncbi:MAG: hypothetical protein JST00_45170 [Deltaproteobacteria bacterium]|nr:hypothetical protein [Deltaproteobacteria bacterium]
MLARRALGILTLAVLSPLAACSSEEVAAPDDDAVTGDDANLTEATARRLAVPLSILKASFYVKPTPIDQSGLGIVIGDGVAFADGATSQALPSITSLDRKPFSKLPTATIAVGEERYGAMFDWDGAGAEPGERLLGKTAPPLLEPGALRVGMSCRVLGTDMDMYASGPPKTRSLAGTIDSIRNGLVLVKSTTSTGGDMTLLVCDGKLAGIRAGAGSQGTWHEYHVLDRATLDAFVAKRDACKAGRCR